MKLPDIHPDLTPEGRKRMHEACVKQTEDTFLRIERMGGRDIFRRCHPRNGQSRRLKTHTLGRIRPQESEDYIDAVWTA